MRIKEIGQRDLKILSNRREWFHQSREQTKDGKIYVAKFTTVHNLLFCVHKLGKSYFFLFTRRSFPGKYSRPVPPQRIQARPKYAYTAGYIVVYVG